MKQYVRGMAQVVIKRPRTQDPYDDEEPVDMSVELTVAGQVTWNPDGEISVDVGSATDRDGNEYDDLPPEEERKVEAALVLEYIERFIGANKYW